MFTLLRTRRWILFSVAVLLGIIGIPIAWWLTFRRRRWTFLLDAIVALPLVLPPTVLGYYLLVGLGARSPFGRAWEHWTGHPFAFTFDALVVASLADVQGDLGMILANFRDQIEPQVRNLGVTLSWHMSDLPPIGALSASETLELFWLLREATLNAARHSGADRVCIEIRAIDHGARIVISDRGGGGAAARPGGQGLPNMHRRAQAIGGRLTIDSGSTGICPSSSVPGSSRCDFVPGVNSMTESPSSLRPATRSRRSLRKAPLPRSAVNISSVIGL